MEKLKKEYDEFKVDARKKYEDNELKLTTEKA